MEENRYSVKDFCNIFNINPNTFPSIAKRLDINTEEYCTIETSDFKTPKRYYNELAYKKIEEYMFLKQKNNIVKEKEVSKYLQKIEDKDRTIEDLRKQLEFAQKLLITEKGEKQQLQQQILLLSENTKKVTELEKEKTKILSTNREYIEKNHELEEQKYELQKEIDRLKGRNLWDRLFNK